MRCPISPNHRLKSQLNIPHVGILNLHPLAKSLSDSGNDIEDFDGLLKKIVASTS
jgi:hypothetical protein